jgi:hypothetical protein
VGHASKITLFIARVLSRIGVKHGKKLVNDFAGSYSSELDLSDFSKGIYMIELKTINGTINKKMILL